VPRKRLRSFLDEVIGDADLRASVERVADIPRPTDSPPLTLASATTDTAEPAAADAPALPAERTLTVELDSPIIELHPAAFPPPPWEAPPELPSATNGHTIAPRLDGADPAAASVDVAPAVLDTQPAGPDEADAILAAAPGAIHAPSPFVLDVPPPLSEDEAPSAFDAPTPFVLDAAPPPAEAPAASALDEGPTAAHHSRAFTDDDLSTALVEHPHAAPVAPAPPAAPILVAAATIAPAAAPSSAEPSARRRRRSASLLPPLPSPTDIPEDAEGRIVIISNAAPMDDPTTTPAPIPADTEPAPITAVGGDVPLAGWLPVLALGAALVLIFIVGVLVTR
jgi:DNA polymerase-3 subunit gamma/tau